MAASMLGNQEFYDRHAAAYEAMNDWPARLALELPFIEQVLRAAGARRVLDAACGSGQHAVALAQRGYEVTAADISAEMLALARRNAAEAGVSLHLEQIGLQAVVGLGGKFDAALCLGNSLPHLLDGRDLSAALAGLRNVVRAGGALVLQDLNYDLRWQTRPRFMALNSTTIDDRPVLFWRMADYHDPGSRVAGLPGPCPEPGAITFHIATLYQETGGQWKATVRSTLQRPLFAQDLADRLRSAGWAQIEMYGGMDGSPFSLGASPDLVIVAR